MSRKYSIDEIDQMRRSLENMYPSGRSYKASERSAEVENRLRTHMQNGTEPQALLDAAGEFSRREYEAHQRTMKAYAAFEKAEPSQARK